MLITEPTALPLDGWPGAVTRRGLFQYPGAVPHSFRPDQFVGVAADPHGIGMRLNFGNHLHIVEIGKDQIPAAFKQMKAEPAPEIDQPLLRMTIKAPVSLHLTKLDGSAHELERQACGAKLLAHGEPLDFG